MKSYRFSFPVILLFVIGIFQSCRGDDKLPYLLEIGTVLGKEVCEQDVANDYWLVNFDIGYGDTVTYKGIFYAHVAKTNQLHPLLKKNNMRVVLGFDISKDKINPTNCFSSSAETYLLKVLQLHSQSELR